MNFMEMVSIIFPYTRDTARLASQPAAATTAAVNNASTNDTFPRNVQRNVLHFTGKQATATDTRVYA